MRKIKASKTPAISVVKYIFINVTVKLRKNNECEKCDAIIGETRYPDSCIDNW